MSETKEASWENLLLPDTGGDEMMAEWFRSRRASLPPPLKPVIIPEKLFTMKKFSYYPRMSEETNSFSADLYFWGKRVGEASNDGKGGCNRIHGDQGLGDLRKWVRDSLPAEAGHSADYLAMTTFGEDPMYPFSPRRMTLDALIDLWVSRKLFASHSVKKPNSCAFCLENGDVSLIRFRTIVDVTQELALANAIRKCDAAVPYSNVVKLPLHYYPCPHDFTQGDAVTFEGAGRYVVSHGTNDSAVVLGSPRGDFSTSEFDKIKHINKD